MTAPFPPSLVSPVLVGREMQLDTLDRLIDQASRSNGSTALITGEAGIGKSRLVAETIRCARSAWREDGSAEPPVLQGRCFEPDRALPYAPLRDLLCTYLAALNRERLVVELPLVRLGSSEVDAMLRAIFELPRPVRAEFLEALYTTTYSHSVCARLRSRVRSSWSWRCGRCRLRKVRSCSAALCSPARLSQVIMVAWWWPNTRVAAETESPSASAVRTSPMRWDGVFRP